MQNTMIRKASRAELRRKFEIIDVIFALLFVIIAIISLVNYTILKGKISAEVEAYGLIGLFFTSAFMEIIPQIFNPIFALVVSIASGINVHLAILLTCLGSVIGSVIGFKIGAKYGINFIASMFDDFSLRRIDNFIEKYGKLCVTIAALTPLPYFPIVFGAFKLSKHDFFVYGIIPRILGFIFVGYAVHLGFVSMNL